MYIGPKMFNGDIEVSHNQSDGCFYLRIGDFEAYLTHAEMDGIARKSTKALEDAESIAASLKNRKK